MRTLKILIAVSTAFAYARLVRSAENPAHNEGESPADHLPSHIRRVTWFGERADWSHDGKRILFVEKTFGDVYEVELESGVIRPLTHHYAHYGYTRARSEEH